MIQSQPYFSDLSGSHMLAYSVLEPTPSHLGTLILSLLSLPGRPMWQIWPMLTLSSLGHSLHVPSGGLPWPGTVWEQYASQPLRQTRVYFLRSAHHPFHWLPYLFCLHPRMSAPWDLFLAVHCCIPKTQNGYRPYQRPLMHFCWKKHFSLLSKKVVVINTPSAVRMLISSPLLLKHFS